jgi:thioredoxin-related protein
MPHSPFTRVILVVSALIVLPVGTTSAQEVNWRHDYNAARRESTETGRPLLFDFGTEACVWCRKLDATTFRDPRVARLLNERFIPVKIDANKEARLTAALAIESYPTLIIATSEGKVVGRHPGYADVNEMLTFLSKAPAPPAAPVATRQMPPPPPVSVESEAERLRRAKEKLDADLATLHTKIAAALDSPK